MSSSKDSRIGLFIALANAAGLAVIAGLLLRWPHYYDRGPPIAWADYFEDAAAVALVVFVPALIVETFSLALLRIFFAEGKNVETGILPLSFLNAVAFGAVVAALSVWSAVSYARMNEAYLVNAVRDCAPAFFAVFTFVLVFECAVRGLFFAVLYVFNRRSRSD